MTTDTSTTQRAHDTTSTAADEGKHVAGVAAGEARDVAADAAPGAQRQWATPSTRCADSSTTRVASRRTGWRARWPCSATTWVGCRRPARAGRRPGPGSGRSGPLAVATPGPAGTGRTARRRTPVRAAASWDLPARRPRRRRRRRPVVARHEGRRSRRRRPGTPGLRRTSGQPPRAAPSRVGQRAADPAAARPSQPLGHRAADPAALGQPRRRRPATPRRRPAPSCAARRAGGMTP